MRHNSCSDLQYICIPRITKVTEKTKQIVATPIFRLLLNSRQQWNSCSQNVSIKQTQMSLSLYEISKGNYFHLFHHHSKRKKVFKCPETVSFFWKKKKRFAVDQKKGRRGNSKPVTAVMSLTWKDANLIGVAAYHTLHSGMPAIPTMPGMSLLSSHHSQLSPKNSLIFFKHNSVFVRWHLVCLATQRSTLPEHEGGSF